MDIFCMFLKKSEESQHSLFVTVCEYHLQGSCPRSMCVCVCVRVCLCVCCMWTHVPMYYRFHVVILEMILSNLMNIWAWSYFPLPSVTLFFLCWRVLPSSLTSAHNKALMMHTFLFCTLLYGKRSVTWTYCQHKKLLCANGSYVVLQTHM